MERMSRRLLRREEFDTMVHHALADFGSGGATIAELTARIYPPEKQTLLGKPLTVLRSQRVREAAVRLDKSGGAGSFFTDKSSATPWNIRYKVKNAPKSNSAKIS